MKCIRRNIFEMKQRLCILCFYLVTTHSFRSVNSHHPLLAGGNQINIWKEDNLEGVSFCLILQMRFLDSATVRGTACMWQKRVSVGFLLFSSDLKAVVCSTQEQVFFMPQNGLLRHLACVLNIGGQFVQQLPFFMIKNQEKGKELEVKNVLFNTKW